MKRKGKFKAVGKRNKLDMKCKQCSNYKLYIQGEPETLLDSKFKSLVFISPRCLEHVGLTKNLAPNRMMSFEAAIFFFFYSLTLSIKNYVNKYLARI